MLKVQLFMYNGLDGHITHTKEWPHTERWPHRKMTTQKNGHTKNGHTKKWPHKKNGHTKIIAIQKNGHSQKCPHKIKAPTVITLNDGKTSTHYSACIYDATDGNA